MISKKINCFIFIAIFLLSTGGWAGQNVFYVLRYYTDARSTPISETVESLKKHHKKIDILIPQAYVIRESGEVVKGIEPEILSLANSYSMKIMPLVTNTEFDGKKAHSFLMNESAQTRAIETLVQLCNTHHFYGVQLDFEMIRLEDKDALTRFFERAANAFHAAGLKISFAIAPVVTDDHNTLFLKKIYENWEGAYDFKSIGTFADFVSIMAYNQHGAGTTPGSTSDFPWLQASVRYALKHIPANKISIGIPAYSVHWFTGSTKVNNKEKVIMRMRALNHKNTMAYLHDHHVKPLWNKELGYSYAMFSKNWVNEYVFIEDVNAFKLKQKLVKNYHLHGISVFDLGTEDQRIWKYL